MIRFLREAGYTNKLIGEHAKVSATAVQKWASGKDCRDPEAFVRLYKLYISVCDKLGVKHD